MAEAEWKDSVDNSIKAMASDKNEIDIMKQQLEGFANRLEAELRTGMEQQLTQRLEELEAGHRQLIAERDASLSSFRPNPVGPVMSNAFPPSMMQKPPMYVEGSDPESYLLQFDLICTSNGWNEDQKCLKLPASLPANLIPWYVQLDDYTKQDFARMSQSFISRFGTANDRHQLQLTYHNLRARNFQSMEQYALKIQAIGIKLGRSVNENLNQFLLGLPDSTYKWVEKQKPDTMECALTQAIDYELMFNRGNRYQSAFPFPNNGYGNNFTHNTPRRQEESMEFSQHGYPQFRERPRGGFFGRRGNYGSYVNQGSNGYFQDGSRPYRGRGFGNHGRGGNQQHSSGDNGPVVGREARVNHETMDRPPNLSWDGYVDRNEVMGNDGEFPAHWFNDNQGNGQNPIVAKNQ